MRICPACGESVAVASRYCPRCAAPRPEPGTVAEPGSIAGAGDLPAAGYPLAPEYHAGLWYPAEPGYPPAPEYHAGLWYPAEPGYPPAQYPPAQYLAAPYEPGPHEPERNDLDGTHLARTYLAGAEPDPWGAVLYEDEPGRPEEFGDRFAGGGWETGAFPALPAPEAEADGEREGTAARLLYSPPGGPRPAWGRRTLSHRTQIVSAALAAVALLTGGVIAWTAFGGHPGATPGTRLAGRQTASHQAGPAPGGRVTPSPSVPAPGGAPILVTMAPGVSQAPDAAMVDGFLVSYFTAINAHDYQQYEGLLIPARRAQLTPAVFARGYGTTTDTGASIVGISASGPGVAATVTFTSQQRAAPGADVTGCTYWDITLYLRKVGGTLLIGRPPASYHAYHRSCP